MHEMLIGGQRAMARKSTDNAGEMVRVSGGPGIALYRPLSEIDLYPEVTDVTVPQILAEVCASYHVTPAALLGRDRTCHVTMARHVAMYLAKRLTDMGEIRLGREFNRDHSSVHHAYHKIKERTEAEPAFRSCMDKLERGLKQW